MEVYFQELKSIMTDLNRAGCDFPERKTIVSPWMDGSGMMEFRSWKKSALIGSLQECRACLHGETYEREK